MTKTIIYASGMNTRMITNQNKTLALALNTRLPHTAPRPAIVRFPSLGGFACWLPHSPSSTTTANLPNHQPSRWPRNAPELCSAPTVATYVITFPTWQCHVWSLCSFCDRKFPSRVPSRVHVQYAEYAAAIILQSKRSGFMEEQLGRGGKSDGL